MGYFSLSGCVFFFFLMGTVYIYVCDNICDIYICFLTFMEISGTSMILYDYMGVFASKDE